MVPTFLPVGNSEAGNLPKFLQHMYDMTHMTLLIIHKNVYAGKLAGQIASGETPQKGGAEPRPEKIHSCQEVSSTGTEQQMSGGSVRNSGAERKEWYRKAREAGMVVPRKEEQGSCGQVARCMGR